MTIIFLLHLIKFGGPYSSFMIYCNQIYTWWKK